MGDDNKRTVNRILSFLHLQGLEPIAKASFGLSRADLQQDAAETGCSAAAQCSQGINADLTLVRSAFSSLHVI